MLPAQQIPVLPCFDLMMVSGHTRRNAAFTLVFLLLAGSWWSVFHIFAAHYDCHDVPVCRVNLDKRESHIHDQRYGSDVCALCDFIKVVGDGPICIEWKMVHTVSRSLRYLFTYAPLSGRIVFLNGYVRGPPCL